MRKKTEDSSSDSEECHSDATTVDQNPPVPTPSSDQDADWLVRLDAASAELLALRSQLPHGGASGCGEATRSSGQANPTAQNPTAQNPTAPNSTGPDSTGSVPTGRNHSTLTDVPVGMDTPPSSPDVGVERPSHGSTCAFHGSSGEESMGAQDPLGARMPNHQEMMHRRS